MKKNTFVFLLLTPGCLRCQFLWFNKYIKVNKIPFYFQDFPEENINFVEHLCKPSRDFTSWREIKAEYNLERKCSISGFNSIMQFQTNRRE